MAGNIRFRDSNWTDSLAFDQIPAALALLAALQSALAARLLEQHGNNQPSSELLDAPTLAHRLGVAVSHVRTLARTGKIPSVSVGRYVRFDPSAVVAALAEPKG